MTLSFRRAHEKRFAPRGVTVRRRPGMDAAVADELTDLRRRLNGVGRIRGMNAESTKRLLGERTGRGSPPPNISYPSVDQIVVLTAPIASTGNYSEWMSVNVPFSIEWFQLTLHDTFYIHGLRISESSLQIIPRFSYLSERLTAKGVFSGAEESEIVELFNAGAVRGTLWQQRFKGMRMFSMIPRTFPGRLVYGNENPSRPRIFGPGMLRIGLAFGPVNTLTGSVAVRLYEAA